MTTLAIKPDWSVALEFDRVASNAARIVAAKYRDNAVGSLAEFDDLRQEARILLATTFAEQARELDEGVLRYRLVRDLVDIVKYRVRDAKDTASLDAMEEDDDE